MITLIIFLVVLSVLVFVHEFGHFIVAKRAGLRVDEFGFGFPPRVVGIRRKTPPHLPLERGGKIFPPVPLSGAGPRGGVRGGGRFEIIWGSPENFDPREGGTLYSINALPIGGFVRIKGESGEGVDEPDSFASRSARTRVTVIAAGVIMNALLAVVLISVGYVKGFPQVLDAEISKYAHVQDRRVEVLGVLPEGPAAKVGIHTGDRVIGGNDKVFQNAEEFKTFVTEFLEKPVQLTLEREGIKKEVNVVPIILEQTAKPGIGVGIADIGVVRYPVWLAVPKGFELTGILLKTVVVSMAALLRDVIIGRPVSADLAGPVGIAVLTGAAARRDLCTFCNLWRFFLLILRS